MNKEWVCVKDRKPNKNGGFLCQDSHGYIVIYNYSDNLYKLDSFDFYNKKNSKDKGGFYDYDSEYGYYEIENVEYWMELPEKAKRESNWNYNMEECPLNIKLKLLSDTQQIFIGTIIYNHDNTFRTRGECYGGDHECFYRSKIVAWKEI